MELFPIQFCKGIRSYWRSRKYKKLKSSSAGNNTGKVTRLGGGRRRGSTRRFRLRTVRSVSKIRIRVFSPVRILARIRDSYVDAMLGVARKGAPGLSAGGGPELVLRRRIPKARPVRPEPGDFERRLIHEIYKSVMDSRELGLYAI